MVIREVVLHKEYAGILSGEGRGVLTAYLHGSSPEMKTRLRPAVLVIPGGGYGMVSARESEPVAMPFYAAGYQVFTLFYSVVPVAFPVQLYEAAAAVHYIRDNAAALGVDAKQLATVGFSAGGHLAAMQATMADAEILQPVFGSLPAGALMPDACILSYAVLSSTAHPHKGSFQNLCGGSDIEPDSVSLEKIVPDNMCPCFLWHCADDGTVDVRNSLVFAAALRDKQIPFAMRIYEKGGHGGSVATEEVLDGAAPYPGDVCGWVNDAKDWLIRHRNFHLVK